MAARPALPATIAGNTAFLTPTSAPTSYMLVQVFPLSADTATAGYLSSFMNPRQGGPPSSTATEGSLPPPALPGIVRTFHVVPLSSERAKPFSFGLTGPTHAALGT